MATPPGPTALYPDVAAAGSLAAALRAAARGGLDAVPVTSPQDGPLLHAVVAGTSPHRDPLQISAWSHERRWSVRGTEPFQSLCLLEGTTDDLAEIAEAARRWHDGAALDDIRRAAPFVRPTGRFEVPDHNPAQLTVSEWRCLRQEAVGLEYAWQGQYKALIDAAYAEPAMRRLYPFTSHWTLRFSNTPRPRLTPIGPGLSASSDGTYGVGTGFEAELGRFATAREAVTAALRHLPPAPGP